MDIVLHPFFAAFGACAAAGMRIMQDDGITDVYPVPTVARKTISKLRAVAPRVADKSFIECADVPKIGGTDGEITLHRRIDDGTSGQIEIAEYKSERCGPADDSAADSVFTRDEYSQCQFGKYPRQFRDRRSPVHHVDFPAAAISNLG